MTTLVTGATGFVGSAVVRRLLEVGHSVRVLIRSESQLDNLDGLSVEKRVGDLRDRSSLDEAVRGCESLFHVAADYRLWSRNPQDLYDINVDGTLNILRAAADAGVSRMVYTSSVATVGIREDGVESDEETLVTLDAMVGHYKRSKFIAEREVRLLAKTQHLPIIVVNPSTPLGPRDIKPTPTGRIVVKAAAGRMPAFVETGLNLVHVDDVADEHLFAHDKGRPGERYILGGENWSLQEILVEIANLTNRKPPNIRLNADFVLPLAYVAQGWAYLTRARREPLMTVDGVKMSRHVMFFSSKKARDYLGYRPRPSREALSDAVMWFKENGYF